jgi:hypothetical protein
MIYRNGHRSGGSTANSDPKSTHEAGGCMPNANSTHVGADLTTPHDGLSTRAEPLVELCSELRDVRQRSAIDGSDRNRTAEAAGPEGAA